MIVNLNLLERINISSLLPQQSSWDTRQVVRGLSAKVAVTAEDQDEFGVATSPPDEQGRSHTTWNEKGAEERPFDLHAKEIALIHAELDKLDKAEKLLPQHDSLCEKFLDSPPSEA